jgi:serine/threonine protein kinase
MPLDMLDVVPLDGSFSEGPLPGEVLARKYRIERVLGRGGMGVVFLARNLQLGQRVAIKFLVNEPTRALTTRLLMEARAAARLRSDHVVRVFDVAETETGAPYVVMEYLEGQCLAEVLRRTPDLPVPRVVGWVLEVCEGLALAHHHAIVHRDLKPANLFLERCPNGSSRIKILDFGVAKLLREAGLSHTTHPVGSPSYMAPEQLANAPDMDARTDIWAVGIVLYELLTGKTPFQAGSILELAIKLRDMAHVPARVLRPGLPKALSEAIDVCLEKQRENRWASVAELAAALGPFGPSGSGSTVARIAHIGSGVEDTSPLRSSDDAVAKGATELSSRLSSRGPNICGMATSVAEVRAAEPALPRGLVWTSMAVLLLVLGYELVSYLERFDGTPPTEARGRRPEVAVLSTTGPSEDGAAPAAVLRQRASAPMSLPHAPTPPAQHALPGGIASATRRDRGIARRAGAAPAGERAGKPAPSDPPAKAADAERAATVEAPSSTPPATVRRPLGPLPIDRQLSW